MESVTQEKVFLQLNIFLIMLFKGWNGSCSVSEYTSNFMGRSMRFKMTSTCGHIMGVDFPARYNNWDRIDPTDLFSCPTEKKEANPKLKIPAVSLFDLLETILLVFCRKL